MTSMPDEPPRSHARMTLAVVGLTLMVVLVLLATLSPTPLDQGYEAPIRRLLDVIHRYGVPEWFGYRALEFSANAAMYVPVGFLVALALPRRAQWSALLIVPAISAVIEVLQATLLAQRFGNLTDVAANTIGGWIGVGLAVALRAVVRRRDQKVIARALWQAEAVR